MRDFRCLDAMSNIVCTVAFHLLGAQNRGPRLKYAAVWVCVSG